MGVEAGVSLFQKDDNYINCIVVRSAKAPAVEDWLVRLIVKEKGEDARIVCEEAIHAYNGTIVFEVKSIDGKYTFKFALDEENSMPLGDIAGDIILSTGYTGTCFGL